MPVSCSCRQPEGEGGLQFSDVCLAQEARAQRLDLEKGMRPSKLKVGDLVLLSTEHYNLQLPSQKLAPKWLGPLKVLEL